MFPNLSTFSTTPLIRLSLSRLVLGGVNLVKSLMLAQTYQLQSLAQPGSDRSKDIGAGMWH